MDKYKTVNMQKDRQHDSWNRSLLKISELNQITYVFISKSPTAGVLVRKMKFSDAVTGEESI